MPSKPKEGHSGENARSLLVVRVASNHGDRVSRTIAVIAIQRRESRLRSQTAPTMIPIGCTCTCDERQKAQNDPDDYGGCSLPGRVSRNSITSISTTVTTPASSASVPISSTAVPISAISARTRRGHTR